MLTSNYRTAVVHIYPRQYYDALMKRCSPRVRSFTTKMRWTDGGMR